MKTRLTTGGIDWHAYQPYRILKRRIISAKKSLIKEIEATIDPFMYETGFCKGRLDRSKTEYHCGFFFTFSDKQEREDKDHYQVGDVQVMGFMRGGLIVTDMCMGALTREMKDLPIEDLLKLHVFVMNRKEFISITGTKPRTIKRATQQAHNR